MSILGYSTSYYLPEYWASTPLYGEQIIALLDEVLSLNYSKSEGLAEVYYDIANKYSNTTDLSIGALEELVDENGYTYVRELLGNDGPSLIILVYLLPMIHQYKGAKTGLETVLNLLRKNINTLSYGVVGSPTIERGSVSNFSGKDYIYFKGLRLDDFSFEISTKITTSTIGASQCIFSVGGYGFGLTLSSQGTLLLSLGNNGESWNIVDGALSEKFLEEDTTYYIKFSFDGYKYSVKVSKDNSKFEEFISVESNETLDIHSGKMYVGVNGAYGTPTSPFLGTISRDGTFVAVENMTITEWFEQLPVATENTFKVSTEVDADLVSSDFFEKFFEFTSKYVYPTLTAFEAKFSYDTNVTFIPHIKQKMSYICSGTYGMTSPFDVKEEGESQWEDFMVKLGSSGSTEIFETITKEDNN